MLFSKTNYLKEIDLKLDENKEYVTEDQDN